MQRVALVAASAMLILSSALAQQDRTPATPDQPPANSSTPPTPLADGSYEQVAGVTPPYVSRSALAVYPGDAAPESVAGACILAVIIGADGRPGDVSVVRSHGTAFDDAAIKAVKHTKFEPGRLNDKRVAVHVNVRVHFSSEHSPAVPMILPRLPLLGRRGADPPDVPPKVTTMVEAELSNEARRARVKGTVVVELTVTEDGYPADARVVRAAGSGLDEKALEAVSKYRFKPAMKGGRPVAAVITIEVRFQL
jgi:TonB family protein